MDDSVDPSELRIGTVLHNDRANALHSAISDAAATIATMPANFTRFPNSDQRVFEVDRPRAPRSAGSGLDLATLRRWGTISVPGHLWRALSRLGPWIEPMLVAEWARLSRTYAERMGVAVPAGVVEAALEWREPVRSTALARHAADRLFAAGRPVECVWTGHRLSLANLDVDHCLPWSAWPCGDLWNLAPSDPRVNRHEKRDRLPSAAIFASSRERLIDWWERAYFEDEALGTRFPPRGKRSATRAGEH